MPAVAIVAEVLVGEFVTDVIGATVANVLGSALVGEIATGVIAGAAAGATGAAITGGDIGQGAALGGLTGGIGSGIGQAAKGIEVGGQSLRSLGQESLGRVGERALERGLSTTFSGVATGQNLGQALTRGGIAGLVDYGMGRFGLDQDTSKAGRALTAAERQLATSALSKALIPETPFRGGGSTATITGTPSPTQYSPGSAALGQALRTDAGAPVFGSSKEDEGRKKSGWNVESLRYMGSEA